MTEHKTSQNEAEASSLQVFMDLEEVSNYLKVSMSTIYRYINDKKNPLPSFKLSRKNIIVNRQELDAWVTTYRKNKNRIEKVVSNKFLGKEK